MSYLSPGCITESTDKKIAQLATMGLMPKQPPHRRNDSFIPHFKSRNGVIEIDSSQRETLSRHTQKDFRRWSRRLNGSESNGTGWVMKNQQKAMKYSRKVNEAVAGTCYEDYTFIQTYHKESYESFHSSSPGYDSSGSYSSSNHYDISKYSYPHRVKDARKTESFYEDRLENTSNRKHQRSKSQGPAYSCHSDDRRRSHSSNFGKPKKVRREWYSRSERKAHLRREQNSNRESYNSQFGFVDSHSSGKSKEEYTTTINSHTNKGSLLSTTHHPSDGNTSNQSSNNRSPRQVLNQQHSNTPLSDKQGRSEPLILQKCTPPSGSSDSGDFWKVIGSRRKSVERERCRNPSPPSHTLPYGKCQPEFHGKPESPVINSTSGTTKSARVNSPVKMKEVSKLTKADIRGGSPGERRDETYPTQEKALSKRKKEMGSPWKSKDKVSPSKLKAKSSPSKTTESTVLINLPLDGFTFFGGRETSKSSTIESQTPSSDCKRSGSIVNLESTPKSNGDDKRISKTGTPKSVNLRSSKKTAGSYINSLQISPDSNHHGSPGPSTKTEEKRKVSRRTTPCKGELKPKALIKAGLRSTKKESKNREDNAVKKGYKSDPIRKLVQKTLETWLSNTNDPKTSGVLKSSGETTKPNAPAGEIQAPVGKKNGVDKGHIRRIYQEDTQVSKYQLEAVVRLTQLPGKLPVSATAEGPKSSNARMVAVPPIPSPAKKRSCESPSIAEPLPKTAKTSPVKVAIVAGEVRLPAPYDESRKVEEEEDDVQARKDEAIRQAEAIQRNKKRHSRGLKVQVYCDVLCEFIERHPVQNEIPAEKWSKWLNPSQLRCMVVTMLDNSDLCLNFTLEMERNEEWEEVWTILAIRLNSICFNEMTQLNTGLRMTVYEWKKCWLELKSRLMKQIEAMRPEERVHSMGSLECLLYSEELYRDLMKSNGECLGARCPRKWCKGACVGVFSLALPNRRNQKDSSGK